MVEVVTWKSTVQAVVDHIDHQHAFLQIPTISENKMKLQEDQHHRQTSFEEAQITWEPEQIIKTKNKQLWNHVMIEYLIKWKNLPIVDLTWEDESFIHMHPSVEENTCMKGGAC